MCSTDTANVSEQSKESVGNTSSESLRCATSEVVSRENAGGSKECVHRSQSKRLPTCLSASPGGHALETESTRVDEGQGSKAKRMRSPDESSSSSLDANFCGQRPAIFEFMDLTGPDKPLVSGKPSFPGSSRFLIKPCFRVPPPSHLAAQLAHKDNLSAEDVLPPWNGLPHGRGSRISSSLDPTLTGDSSSPRKPPGRINPLPVTQSHAFPTSSLPLTSNDSGKGVVGQLISSISLSFPPFAGSRSSLNSRLSAAPNTSGLGVHLVPPLLPPFTPSSSSAFFIKNLLTSKASQPVNGSPQARSYSAFSRNLPFLPPPANVGVRSRPWTLPPAEGTFKFPLHHGSPAQSQLPFRDQMLKIMASQSTSTTGPIRFASSSQHLHTIYQNNQPTPLNFSCPPSAIHRQHLPSPTSSKMDGAWSAFKKPVTFKSTELNPAEEFLWNNNFFGSRSIPQLTYTLIFMLGKMLGLRTGTQLRQMRLGPRGQLKLILGRNCYPDSTATSCLASPSTPTPRNMPYELFYTPANEAFASESPPETSGKPRSPSLNELSKRNPVIMTLGHVLLRTPRGFLIKHCSENEHKRCLVCLHMLLLLERKKWASENPRNAKVECYFLSWQSTDSSKAPGFRVRPLGHNALSAIIHNIEATLRNVTVGLRTGVKFLAPILWLAHPQEQLHSTSSVLATPKRTPKPASGTMAGVANSSVATESLQPLDLSKQSSLSNSLSNETGTAAAGCVPTLNQHALNTNSCSGGAHPTCLDYWPELTARARKEEWQCADCKSCSICKDATSEAVVLICDACDRGYHTTCHNPPVLEEVDRNMPWVCSQCQVEAYQRQLPQETGDQESSDTQAAGSSASQLIDEEAETPGQTRADGRGPNERSFDGTNATTSTENTPSVVGVMAPTDSSEELNLGTAAIVNSPAATTDLLSAECSYPSSSPSNGDVKRALRSPKPNGNVPEDAASQMPVLDCESVCPPTDSALGREMPSTFAADENAELHSEEKENLVTVSLPVKNPKDCPVPDNIGSKRTGEGRTDETAVMGASSQPRPEDVKAWTVSEVSDWLTEEGFTKEAETFAQQDIDGASLILMKRMDVFTELGIKLGPAVKIYERIKRLQATCISQDP